MRANMKTRSISLSLSYHIHQRGVVGFFFCNRNVLYFIRAKNLIQTLIFIREVEVIWFVSFSFPTIFLLFPYYFPTIPHDFSPPYVSSRKGERGLGGLRDVRGRGGEGGRLLSLTLSKKVGMDLRWRCAGGGGGGGG